MNCFDPSALTPLPIHSFCDEWFTNVTVWLTAAVAAGAVRVGAAAPVTVAAVTVVPVTVAPVAAPAPVLGSTTVSAAAAAATNSLVRNPRMTSPFRSVQQVRLVPGEVPRMRVNRW